MRDSDAALLRNSPEALSLPTASLQNKKINLLAQVNLDRQISFLFAESGGFEPSIRLRVYRISSAALSTTQTTFL